MPEYHGLELVSRVPTLLPSPALLLPPIPMKLPSLAQPARSVKIAAAKVIFRMNILRGWLLGNGSPRITDVGITM
jgi:hypothetical protein